MYSIQDLLWLFGTRATEAGSRRRRACAPSCIGNGRAQYTALRYVGHRLVCSISSDRIQDLLWLLGTRARREGQRQIDAY